MSAQKQCGIMVGLDCSNRCKFCAGGKGFKQVKQDLKKQEIGIWKDLLNYKKKGYRDIEISGNDPLEYEKIVSLVKYIKKCGFKNILLNTHGKDLSDKRLADDLIKAGVNGFRIPIYSTKAHVHDEVTGVLGSYDLTIKGLKNILYLLLNFFCIL